MAPPESKKTSRDLIFSSASVLFADRGYAATTVRDIASAASVDAALIIRHFGSKENLFLETMSLDLEHAGLFDGPIHDLGVRYIRAMLDSEAPVRSIFLALVRASDSNGVGLRLRDAHEAQFVAPLRSRLTGPDSELRARLAAALVGGLLYSLWIVEDQTLVTEDRERIAVAYGTLLQRIITPDPV